MADAFCVIIAEDLNGTQREQIQAVVEKKTVSWWHQMSDVWIVESDLTASGWTQALSPIFPSNYPSKLLIMLLPTGVGGRWSAIMPAQDAEWLLEHLVVRKAEPKGTRDPE